MVEQEQPTMTGGHPVPGDTPVRECGELEAACVGLRAVILQSAEMVLNLKTAPEISLPEEFRGQRGEQIANIVLSYRHLEDARMRLGKVMQRLVLDIREQIPGVYINQKLLEFVDKKLREHFFYM